jgi:hypothetical protein
VAVVIDKLPAFPVPESATGMVSFTVKSGDTLVFFTDGASAEDLRHVQLGYRQRGLDVITMLLPADCDIAVLDTEKLEKLHEQIGQVLKTRPRVQLAKTEILPPT